MAGADNIQKCDNVALAEQSPVAVRHRTACLQNCPDTDMTGNQRIRHSRQFPMPQVNISPTDFRGDGLNQNPAGFHGWNWVTTDLNRHSRRGDHGGPHGIRKEFHCSAGYRASATTDNRQRLRTGRCRRGAGAPLSPRPLFGRSCPGTYLGPHGQSARRHRWHPAGMWRHRPRFRFGRLPAGLRPR